ncbi:hypothetical protein ACFL12_03465 [Pseudomonadota bacterium]
MTIKNTMIAAIAGVTLLCGGAAFAAGHGHGHGQTQAPAQTQAEGAVLVPDAPCNCTDGTCPMYQGGAAHDCQNGNCPMNADGTQHTCKDGTCNHGGQGGHMGGKHAKGSTCNHGGQHGNMHGGGGVSSMSFTIDDARSVLDQKIQLKKDAGLKIGTVTQVDAAFIRGTIVDASGKVVADYIFTVATGDWTKVN